VETPSRSSGKEIKADTKDHLVDPVILSRKFFFIHFQ
jgi:hypothetical protein